MIRVVRLSFKEEHQNDFLAFFDERKERIRNVHGCTYLQLWRDQAHSNVFYTYSIWNDIHALNAYRDSDFFKDTWSQVKRWFNEKPLAFSANEERTLL